MMHYDQLFVFGWDSNRIQAPTISCKKSSWNNSGMPHGGFWRWLSMMKLPKLTTLLYHSCEQSGTSQIQSSIAGTSNMKVGCISVELMMRSLYHRIYTTIIYIYTHTYTVYLIPNSVLLSNLTPPFGWTTPQEEEEALDPDAVPAEQEQRMEQEHRTVGWMLMGQGVMGCQDLGKSYLDVLGCYNSCIKA